MLVSKKRRTFPALTALLALAGVFGAASPTAAQEAAETFETAPVSSGPTVEQVDQLIERGDVNSAGQLLLQLARERFRQGDAATARQHLDRYLAIHERQNARFDRDDGNELRRRQLLQVVGTLLQFGDVARGLELLGEYVDSQPPTNRYASDRMAATGAALASAVMRMPAEERYRLLKQWTFPTADRNSVRMFAATVSEVRPPAVFVEALPADRGETDFHVPTAGLTPCVVDTAHLLISSAREIEMLDELAAETDQLADRKVPRADLLSLLVHLARGEGENLRDQLVALNARLTENAPEHRDYDAEFPFLEYALARATTSEPALRVQANALLQSLLLWSRRSFNHRMQHYVLRDQTAGLTRQRNLSFANTVFDPGLEYWDPAAHYTAMDYQAGCVRSCWISHDGHVDRRTGSNADYLFFVYPLLGEFEFSFDTWNTGWLEGHASYGGMNYQVYAYNNTGGLHAFGQSGWISRSTPFVESRRFNRVTFRVRPGRAECLLNGHIFHVDEGPFHTSPWIAMLGSWTQQTSFRNPRLTGNPIIPREVKLLDGASLRGWNAQFYYEQIPDQLHAAAAQRRSVQLTEQIRAGYDWYAEDGVLYGRSMATGRPGEPQQSRLHYGRPMRRHESVSYQFYYEPERMMAHPALDRLVFLLKPEGVRLHWMTCSPDAPWPGLSADNEVEVREARRGPERLPLKPGAWNDVRLALETVPRQGLTVRLFLNDVLVFERLLDADSDRLFGFFHYKDRTAARVRNVVLRGDWPEKLTRQHLADLMAPDRRLPAPSDELAVARENIISERNYSFDAPDVYREAVKLPAEERYHLLLDWVTPLPDAPGQRTLRLYGDFAVEPGRNGGRIVAPAILLVETAQELGKLNELSAHVEQLRLGTGLAGVRARAAMLAMIRLAQGKPMEAVAEVEQLQLAVAQIQSKGPDHNYCPELAVASQLIPRRVALPQLLAVLDHVERIPEKNVSDAFLRHWQHLRGQCRLLQQPGRGDFDPLERAILQYWQPASHQTAQSRGDGAPQAVWQLHDGRLGHWAGCHDDALYFRIPLRGDFEVSAEMLGPDPLQIAYAGVAVGLEPDGKIVTASHMGHDPQHIILDQPATVPGKPYSYRMIVRGGVQSVFINDRQIYRRALPADSDPWLAVYSLSERHGELRNLQITGKPTIPRELKLSGTDLSGWQGDYYGRPYHEEWGQTPIPPDWKHEDEMLVGRKDTYPVKTKRESILRYHRPLAEDGEIEYEFYFSPDAIHVHPAIGRLVFALHPNGVKLHRLTDGKHEQTGLLPENAAVEADNRRGPQDLPLKPDAWNKATLVLKGDAVSLALNGVEVYARPLPAGDARTFGLFHYYDETESQVRNVVHRGEWPTELPGRDQLLAESR